jgi:hypothetical protein
MVSKVVVTLMVVLLVVQSCAASRQVLQSTTTTTFSVEHKADGPTKFQGSHSESSSGATRTVEAHVDTKGNSGASASKTETKRGNGLP